MIVIFTNQSKSWKHDQIVLVAKTLEIPLYVVIATEKPEYKPNILMFSILTGDKNIDKEKSFFVGDALGRKGDFADSDKVFAENIGIKYFAPEDIFDKDKNKDKIIGKENDSEKNINIYNLHNLDKNNVKEYKALLHKYNAIISYLAKNKKNNIIELENIYRNSYVTTINNRTPKYLIKDDLINVMEWKLARGKYRPLLKLLKTNTEDEIINISTSAFKLVEDNKDILAIKKLSELKAVGPATATAILCQFYPRIPFMDDFTLEKIIGKKEYSIKGFIELQNKLIIKSEEFNNNDDNFWTPDKISTLIFIQGYIDKI